MLKTPFVTGFFRPKIYIPAGFSDEERRYIVLHEQVHVRRYDHIAKMLAYLILCFHWFNPLVWSAFVLMSVDMEMSCDERVVRELGDEIKNAYSLSLVRAAAGYKILNGSPLAFGESGMRERVKNILNFRKPSKVTIVAAVSLVLVLSLGFAFDRDFIEPVGIHGNSLTEKLGYSKGLVSNALNRRTVFSENNEQIIELIIKSLPLQANREYVSFSFENGHEISIVYEFASSGGYSYRAGLDPFPKTVIENNALLLFASVNGLKKVNFIHYDISQELNRVDSYTMNDLSVRFGEIDPLLMGLEDLYGCLVSNAQISEFYFAHSSRLYLGSSPDDVVYRNGEPGGVIQQENGFAIWVYSELNTESALALLDGWQIDSGHAELYYFGRYSPESTDNPAILYATMIYESNGSSYNELVTHLGYPSVSSDIGNDVRYIAYCLREGEQTNAYFILNDDRVVAHGIMYGTDYTVLCGNIT